MIIDEQAEFRSLLMHHLTAHWPDAVISAYDPTSAGHLPDEFGGAGNDVILLGNRHGEDRDGIEAWSRFLQRRNFPPVIYFGSEEDELANAESQPRAAFLRDDIHHDELVREVASAINAGRGQVPGEASAADLRSSTPPAIKGYRIVETIGSTERSGVYLAEREATSSQIVLKVLRQLSEVDDGINALERFLQEYEAIAGVDHPNIVKIFDLGISDAWAHIAMEYLEGGDLRSKIAAGVSQEEAVEYMRQMAGALSAVHREKILHRDLKPANIMLRSDDSLALIDFGLAKHARLTTAITDEGEIFGTPYYMSPEQGHGNSVDERSDIYSLGVIFFELLSGARPYDADTAMGIIFKHAQAPIPALPEHVASYQPLIDRMLAKHPADRLASAAEVSELL